LLADYADALAMSQGRSFAGKPMELVRAALKIDPNQWKALAMAGSEAFDRKDYKAAVEYWQRVQDTTPAESPIRQRIQGSIDEARSLAGMPPVVAQAQRSGAASPSEARSVSGTVTLSPALASKVRPDDSVFVFARPADGSRMPVAVVRARVSELPLRFTLDDSRAMAPTAKISALNEVMVNARVSRSGNAIPASGDLEGATEKVKVGTQGMSLVIDRAIP
jgi:cytochrome c-type biogenesis protein CcmH